MPSNKVAWAAVGIPMNGMKYRSSVNSRDNFSTRREVIVGDVTHARLPPQSDPSIWLACFLEHTRKDLAALAVGEFPRRVIEEPSENLATLPRPCVARCDGPGCARHGELRPSDAATGRA